MIRLIDFEATGKDEGALVCEVGHTDLDPATLAIGPTEAFLCRVEAMPPDTRAIHHIRAADTADWPPYDRRCLFEHAARAGVTCWAAHSADFEARYLLGSIPLICTYKASLRVWPDAPAHGVFALLYWLEDQGKVELDPARAYPPHRAGPDSYATALLLREVLAEGYGARELFQWTREPALMMRCPIGAWRGHLWAEVETSMLEWIIWKARDLGEDVRWNARREYDRRRDGYE